MFSLHREFEPGRNDNCEELAPFVMGLFDGELDALSASRARAHLLVCENCARRWLDWNRTRTLLREAPLPAPPPMLLWRVLMACRLSAFTRQKQRKLGGFSHSAPEKAAPADLSAQILARTTRPSVAAPVPAPAPVPRTPARFGAASPKKTFPFHKSRLAASRFKALPSLAVPSLALWLLVLQRDGFSPLLALSPQNLDLAAPSLQATPNASIQRAKAASSARAVSFSPRILPQKHSSVPNIPLRSGAFEALALMEKVRLVASKTGSQPALNDVARPKTSVLAENDAAIMAFSTAIASAATSKSTDSKSTETGAGLGLDTAARPVMASSRRLDSKTASFRSSSVRLASLSVTSLRVASLSHERSAPRLRAAAWQNSMPRLARLLDVSALSAQSLRVSMPPAMPSSPQLLALADTSEADEARVEEMRVAVDDFRAALSPDEPAAPDSDDSAG